ncbi:hypothetical protein ACHAWF_004445 [Thalassiosira exigua]
MRSTLLLSLSNAVASTFARHNIDIAMFPFSFLFSSVRVSDRIEALREAEGRLFEYARTRFGHPDDADAARAEDEEGRRFELFDTPVRVPSVIRGEAASCQLRGDGGQDYLLHGVKVTDGRPSSADAAGATTAERPPPAPLVLLHGYANGSLYFYRNLVGLSRHFGSVFALDLLGWGLSSRPKFDLTPTPPNESDGADGAASDDGRDRRKVASAESFFVESLESWRRKHDLPKLTLAGHSMGGYLSVAYAERYPHRVERLILLSPVGVPEKRPEDERKLDDLPLSARAMIKVARGLFDRGVTPGTFLRSLPHSKSRQMVEGYICNRLPAISCPEEQKHLGEYLYQNSMLPGSGEHCLSEILTAGAFAKVPLVHRIPNLRSEEGMEVHFVYGQNDWMDFRGGMDVQRACHRKWQEWKQGRDQEEKRQPLHLDGFDGPDGDASNRDGRPPPKVFVHGVSDASHLLMLDNYREFNAALIVASGGKLPPDMPRPMEFACDEVAAGTRDASRRLPRNVVGEEGAVAFFRGPRWNRGRRMEQEEDQSSYGLEEKKMEEQ